MSPPRKATFPKAHRPGTPPTPPPTVVPAVDYCTVAAAAAGCFLNSLDGEFVYDDHQAIVANPDVVSSSFSLANDFWGGPIASKASHKSWRPLTTLSFRANFHLHGLRPLGFHAVNVILHVICTLLVLRLAQRTVIGRVARLFAALLFAVHPIHCEAVSGIVGRADLLAALCVLAGLTANTSLPYTAAATVVGLACKETAIVLPVLIGVRSAIDRRRFSSIAPLAMLTGVLCMARLSVQSFERPLFSPADNPSAAHPSLLVRSLTYLTLPAAHLWLLIYPKTLSFDWSMNAVPLVTSPIDYRFVAAIIVYAAIATLACRALRAASDTYSSRLLFSLALLALPHTLVSSNLLATVGFVLAERVLYLPSAGLALLAGLAVEKAERRFAGHRSLLLLCFLPIVLGVLTARTLTRNEDWRDELRLFESAVEINPAKAFANMGHVLARRGRSAEAEEAYLKALAHRPTMAETHYNLGVLHSSGGNQSAAAAAYERALRLRPAFAPAHLNLGLALRSGGRRAEAAAAFTACSRLDAASSKAAVQQLAALASCSFNLGSMLADGEKHEEAINAFNRALSLAPPTHASLPSIWTMLGESYAAIGADRKAERCFDGALLADPGHSPALLTAAQLRLRQNRSSEACSLLRRAAAIAPRSALVHLHLGLALQRAGDVESARRELELAVSCEGRSSSEAHLALAALERSEGRNERAERILRDLVSFSRAPGVLSTLAAQLHLNKKYSEAEQLYDEAIRSDPSDTVSRENREKLRRILAKLR